MTIEEIQEAMGADGSKWWSKATMEAFGTTVFDEVHDGGNLHNKETNRIGTAYGFIGTWGEANLLAAMSATSSRCPS